MKDIIQREKKGRGGGEEEKKSSGQDDARFTILSYLVFLPYLHRVYYLWI